MGDNFRFDVCSEGRTHFDLVMQLAMSKHTTVKDYRINETKLVLYWTGSKKSVPLPYKMDDKAVVEFAWNWLQTVEYGEEPDHDGDNGKGWRIYNESWGHVDDEWEAFVGIQPVWQIYGK